MVKPTLYIVRPPRAVVGELKSTLTGPTACGVTTLTAADAASGSTLVMTVSGPAVPGLTMPLSVIFTAWPPWMTPPARKQLIFRVVWLPLSQDPTFVAPSKTAEPE